MKIWHEKVDIALIEPDADNFNTQTERVFNTIVANLRKTKKLLSVPLIRVLKWKNKKKRIVAKYRCVDGHHRIEAYRAAGLTDPILCVVTDMGEREAASYMMGMNNLTGEPDEKRLGTLIDKMIDNMGADLEDISKETGFTPGEIDAYLAEVGADIDPLDGLEVGTPESPNKALQELDEEAWEQWTFYVNEPQGQQIHRAIDLAKKLLRVSTENPEGDALEFICSIFLKRKSHRIEDGVLFSVPVPIKKDFNDLFERWKAANPGSSMEEFVTAMMEPLDNSLPDIVEGGKRRRVSKKKAVGKMSGAKK